MAQRFLDLQTETAGLSPRREDLYFPQGQVEGAERALCPFPPHPLPGEERRGPGQPADSEAWSADTSMLGNTMDCWPESYPKPSSREPVVAEADQTEDGTIASCSQHEDNAHNLVSGADSWNGLRWLGARPESWVDAAKENGSNTGQQQQQQQTVSKRTKGRTTFSGDQLRVLQQRFHLQRYVSASERQELGHVLGMSSQQAVPAAQGDLTPWRCCISEHCCAWPWNLYLAACTCRILCYAAHLEDV
ncbi:uncharacterized protein LOC129716162 [Leucoraja erinacea]|uniref:uncharacterized protein LOC129716162 n=1 Tax=Leucoraja erinaceus TaxID=7782 RepID=UPI002455894C|nr:uncharacterized protein LOC129716162 [Leucoraja erinacea]